MDDELDEAALAEAMGAAPAYNATKFAARLRVLVGEQFAALIDWLLETASDLKYPITPDEGRPRDQCGINWIDHAIYINPNREPGCDVFWDLLHEVGHISAGSAPHGQTVDGRVVWEEAAWERGWSLAVDRWPMLDEHRDAFRAHADSCVETYRRNGSRV